MTTTTTRSNMPYHREMTDHVTKGHQYCHSPLGGRAKVHPLWEVVGFEGVKPPLGDLNWNAGLGSAVINICGQC
jgi:hypothetical protein